MKFRRTIGSVVSNGDFPKNPLEGNRCRISELVTYRAKGKINFFHKDN